MVKDVAVLVVGAGPTGLLLAAELKRRGVDCLVIDAHENPLTWDRATVVHPRSVEIFDALGIADPLLKIGARQRLARIFSNGVPLAEIDLALCGSRFPFNVGVSEEVTEAILTSYLESFGGAVTRATQLVGLEERGDGVLATMDCKGEEIEVLARWVVGCDGHRSTVRDLAGIEQDGHPIEEAWAVFDAAVDGWPYSHEGNFAYFDIPPIILTALPDQRWRAYVRPSGEASDLVADATLTLRRYLPEASFAEVANPVRFHCHSKVARQYRRGRLLLAGDAAHTCSPLQGHGMNTGIQDAFNLAWKLALVSSGQCADTLLDSYEAERRPVAENIVRTGDEVDRAQLIEGAAPRRMRDASIRAAFADPVTRHQEAVAEAELDIDYGASPIVMGARSDALAPGQLWPDHIEVRPAGGAPFVLNALANRTGHTALLIAGAAASQEDLGRLQLALAAQMGSPILEANLVLAAHGPTADGHAGIDPEVAERLGVDGLTLFVVRPDGYLGLRADEGHMKALAAYAAGLGAA
ncbi:FAD-dependent monooxygenase [Ancylobacter oerskovii]|uniref:FAD-dependent monooxygenase n=1 Tax=Ancylobacter oerskovii TaxID=459519 RepID=A0ABW4YYV8_9HYPH|nr:FAD-dependent monooxygenase [Ancylobacter oerskovii]